jgi:hypothetical protein
MDAHNNSQVVARFVGIAKPILDGDVDLVTGTEISRQGLTQETARSAENAPQAVDLYQNETFH